MVVCSPGASQQEFARLHESIKAAALECEQLIGTYMLTRLTSGFKVTLSGDLHTILCIEDLSVAAKSMERTGFSPTRPHPTSVSEWEAHLAKCLGVQKALLQDGVTHLCMC